MNFNEPNSANDEIRDRIAVLSSKIKARRDRAAEARAEADACDLDAKRLEAIRNEYEALLRPAPVVFDGDSLISLIRRTQKKRGQTPSV